jgi:chloride channel protein, CIC family
MSPVYTIRNRWHYFYRNYLATETNKMVGLALIVGGISGLGAVFFRWLIAVFHDLFFVKGGEALGFMGEYYVVIIPAVGGLLVGLLVYFFAREAKGHGVPEVQEAVALRGGRIRPVVAIVKSLASSICIGSGGSVGREGPIVQIGSALGSTVGQVLHLSDRRIRNLVACGAAAGIAATFNTPVAAVIFALEVILLEFAVEAFSTVIIAAVIATAIGRAVMGDVPAFEVPAYALVSWWELILYVGLGILCGLVATIFIRILHSSEDIFDKLKLPEYVKPAIGGLAIGVIGLFLPQIFGVGYQAMTDALLGNLPVTILGALVIAKLVATSLTLGSGGSGGVFAPSLFMGAMLGGFYGNIAHGWWPDLVAPSGAYAMVAMGALFAASARAPISAIIILFEMTHDYHVIVPLMFATVSATMLAEFISADSIYSIKLKRRGVDLSRKKDFTFLRKITAETAMKPVSRLTTVSPEMPIENMARLFKETFHHGFAVVSDAGDFFGLITLKDMEGALLVKDMAGKMVKDLCTTRVVTAFPDETLEDVLRCFGALDVGRIPVVKREDPRKLVGMLRWSDIVRSYSQVMLDMEYEPGTMLIKCDISEGDRAVKKSLREIALPADYVVNSIQRGKHLVVPRGSTIIEAGDKLVILASEGKEEEVSTYLYGNSHHVNPRDIDVD